jgi:hypothetical protein
MTLELPIDQRSTNHGEARTVGQSLRARQILGCQSKIDYAGDECIEALIARRRRWGHRQRDSLCTMFASKVVSQLDDSSIGTVLVVGGDKASCGVSGFGDRCALCRERREAKPRTT